MDLGRGRANAVLTAALESVDASLIDDEHIYDNRQIGLRTHVGASDLRRAVHEVGDKVRSDLTSVTPFVTERALKQLKVADLLPPELARATLERRLFDTAAPWRSSRSRLPRSADSTSH